MPLMGSIYLAGYEKIKIGKCAECKKRFTYTKFHRYARKGKDGRTKLYCSYHCYRVKAAEYEAKEREAFEKECQREEERRLRAEAYYKAMSEAGRTTDDIPVIIDLKNAQKYSAHVDEKIALYSKAWLSAEPGTAARERARKSLTRWEKKYKAIRERIEELKKAGEEND